MADGPSTSKLYVAGVSWNTTDDAFHNFFAQFGDVEEALVMRDSVTARSRGFGFITFKDPANVDKVMSQQLQLDGRKLDIKMAVPKGEMQQMGGTESVDTSKKLYVAGISFACTEESVSAFFGRFGTVEKTMIMKDRVSGRSRGFCFVSFTEPGSVAAVLSEHAVTKLEIEGRTLDMKPAVPRGSNIPGAGMGGRAPAFSPGAVRQNKKLYIAGLCASTTEDSFQAHFAQFGTVIEAYIQKNRTTGVSRGFGFITFETVESVSKTLEYAMHTLDGQKIDCKMAVPKQTSMGGGSQGASMYNMDQYGGGAGMRPQDAAAYSAYASQYRQQGVQEQGQGQAYRQEQGGAYASYAAPAAASRPQGGGAYEQRFNQAPYQAAAYPNGSSYSAANTPSPAYEAYASEAQQPGPAARPAYATPAASAYQQAAPRSADPYGAGGYGAGAPGYEQEAGYGAYGARRDVRAVGFHPYSRT